MGFFLPFDVKHLNSEEAEIASSAVVDLLIGARTADLVAANATKLERAGYQWCYLFSRLVNGTLHTLHSGPFSHSGSDLRITLSL